MKLHHQLLKYPQVIPEKHVFMFTANKTVMRNRELIMGGGNALAFKEKYPQTPKLFGYFLSNPALDLEGASLCFFDAFRANVQGEGLVGCMFTKNHPKDPSPLDLVVRGIEELKQLAETKATTFTFHLPYPAIGLGGLTREQLDPYMEQLPDNVWVYVS